MEQFKKVNCPNCGRTLSHYLGGFDSVYRNVCQKCKETIIIYSAGRTMIQKNISIEIEIKF